MMDAPNAASVGATMAPMAAATQSPAPEKSPAARAAPAPMVRGNPIPRRRTGCARSARSCWTFTRDASAKRTRASVTSARERTADECRLRCTKAVGPWVTTRPRTTKRDRCRHVPALEASRDEAPEDDTGRDHRHHGENEVVSHRGRRRAGSVAGLARSPTPAILSRLTPRLRPGVHPERVTAHARNHTAGPLARARDTAARRARPSSTGPAPVKKKEDIIGMDRRGGREHRDRHR